MIKKNLSVMLVVIMLISLIGTPVFAEEDGIIFTPTSNNCIEFSGWSGTSRLTRFDGKTMAPLGSGAAKFEVPEELNGWTTLYYWVPKYADGYSESITCSTKIELTNADDYVRSLSIRITEGNGGMWVSLGCALFSDTEAEYVNVVGGALGENRLTDIKFVSGGYPTYIILPRDFICAGDWELSNGKEYGAYYDEILNAMTTGKGNAFVNGKNLIPGKYYIYVHSLDSDYRTGSRKFSLKANGQKIRKSLFYQFGTHLNGTEFDDLYQDSEQANMYFGWEKANYPSETITVGEDGILKLEAVAGSQYARFDAIVVTQDPDFDIKQSGEQGIERGEPIQVKIPYEDAVSYPNAYKGSMSTVENTVVLSNNNTSISFRKGVLENGETVVQREIKSKGIVTVPYDNGFGFMSVYASRSTDYQDGGYYSTYYTEFPSDVGTEIKSNTKNIYRAGVPEWIIPKTLEQIDAKTVRMTADGIYADIVAVWTLEEDDLEPKVTVTATAKLDGELSFGFFNEVQEINKSEVGYILNPYRWQEKRLPEPGVGITETNSTTNHSQMTYKIDHEGREITLGVAVDQSSIERTVEIEGSEYKAGRWPHDSVSKTFQREWDEDKLPDGTYKETILDYTCENADFVINITGNNGGVLPAIFAPKLSSVDSAFKAGDTYTFSYRPLSIVSTTGENRGWYDAYKHVAQDLRGVYDYRDNYYSSMTDAVFNILNFLKDDEASGWDSNMVGHYNIEDSYWATNANGLVYLQSYLLTGDKDLLMRRTLPSMGAMLTRNSPHVYNKFSIRNQSEGPINKELEYTAISMGNTTFEGAYLLSRGQMPVFRKIAKNRFMNTEVESAGLNLKNTTDYYWYERANGSTTFPLAILNADEYLNKRSFLLTDKIPGYDDFINTSYSPQFQVQLDAYEITGDEKYLEGAVEGARRFLPSLRITDMPESKDEMWIENTEQLVAQDKFDRSRAWSAGDRRYRRGAVMETVGNGIYANGTTYQEYVNRGYDENYMNVRDMTEPYPAWVASRTGLGVEAFSTCTEGRNISMSTWAGDVLRLGYLSNDELMMDLARSSLVGRFANYPGYYITNYTTLYGLENYPTESYDITSLYFHHGPVLLAAVQDYLFSNAYVKSDGKVDFPNTRVQGYAWFNNRIYGHEAGVIYDEKDMWPWLEEGTIEVSSKQIDWIAGRNEGRAAFVLTNAGDNVENITVTFNKELGIADGSDAIIYDKAGNITSKAITNNTLNITIPKKGIMTIAVSGLGIHIPTYATIKFDGTKQNELGETALGLMYAGRTYQPGYTIDSNGNFSSAYNIDKGYDVKAYALSLAPDSYMGYIFVGGRSTENFEFINENGYKQTGGGDGENGIIKSTLKWHFEGENEVTTVTDDLFPYEFFIPVESRDKKIVFTVETEFENETRTLGREYTIAPQEIELEDTKKLTFAPVSMSILNALGSVSSPLTTGDSKYCIASSNVKNIPFDVTPYDALKGCYLSGYLKVKDLPTTKDITEKGYILFDNIPIVNSAINTSKNNRLDFSVKGIEIDIKDMHEYENGVYIGEKQGFVNCLPSGQEVYEWDNLYITNASAKKGFHIVKDKNTYTLATDGAKSCFVAVATYDGSGKMLDLKAEQVIVSVNNSKTYTLSANQKLFVWENDVNKGTTMKPIYTNQYIEQ